MNEVVYIYASHWSTLGFNVDCLRDETFLALYFKTPMLSL